MILHINQTLHFKDFAWEIKTSDGQQFAMAEAPFSTKKYEIFLNYSDGTFLRMYFNPEDTTWGTKRADRASFKLFDNLSNSNRIGLIAQKSELLGFLKSYIYRDFELYGETYQCYEIGMGGKGMFLCIYHNGKLVVTIDKSLQVINYNDTYTAYLFEEKYAKIAVAFALYYDSVACDSMYNRSLYSRKVTITYTIQKSLREKYNPDFIPQVKSMHGITE